MWRNDRLTDFFTMEDMECMEDFLEGSSRGIGIDDRLLGFFTMEDMESMEFFLEGSS